MAKAMSTSRKRRVYEVCLSVFFVFSTSACANMGGGSSSSDDDLDVDLLAILTEPEEKDLELESAQSDAEMVAEYQHGSSDNDEGAIIEGVSDPFGDAFSGSSGTDSEVAEEPSGDGTADELEVEAPIISESEAPDGKNEKEHARAGGQETTSEHYLDLNDDESVDFLLEGKDGERTSAADSNVNSESNANNPAGEKQNDEMLLAAVGDDSAGFADDEDEAIQENSNVYEFQDSFLSDVIADQGSSAGKKTNYLAETSFEPNSEVPEEMDEGDLEVDMGAMIASMQTDQMIPAKVVANTVVARVEIPAARLVHPEIVGETAVVAKVVRSDNRMASAGGAVAKTRKEQIQSTVENNVRTSETVKIVQVADLPRIRPETLHLQMLRDPKTVAYSGKSSDPSAPEKFVKVYIDGRPAIVGVKKPRSSMNTASVKNRSPSTRLAIASLKFERKRPEQMPIRLALSARQSGTKVVSTVQESDDSRSDRDRSKKRDSSHFDLTNKLILPKRDELIFG